MKHDWEYKKLGDCFSYIKNGANIKQDKIRIGYPITRIETLSNGVFNRDKMGYAGITELGKYKANVLEDKDLLMSHINSKTYVGRTVVYDKHGDEKIIHGMNLLRLIPCNFIISSYFQYHTQSSYFKNCIARIRKDAVNQSSFAIGDLIRIPIPVPPIPIQQQIVAELDKVSEIIEKKKQQVKELDNLAQSIFYDMFGDPVENEKGWEVRPLAENVEEMFLGPFGSALKVDSYVEKKDAFCMVYEQKHAIKAKMDFEDTHYITEEKYLSLQRFAVREGDFIMSCRGTIGKVYQLPKGAPLGIIHPSLMKIRIKNSYNSIFFKDLLIKVVSNENTNGNCVQMAITAKELGRKNIILPPLPLQQTFAQKIEAIERQKELITASIKEAQMLFDARMDYWFGE